MSVSAHLYVSTMLQSWGLNSEQFGSSRNLKILPKCYGSMYRMEAPVRGDTLDLRLCQVLNAFNRSTPVPLLAPAYNYYQRKDWKRCCKVTLKLTLICETTLVMNYYKQQSS